MDWNALEAATMTEQGFVLVNGEYKDKDTEKQVRTGTQATCTLCKDTGARSHVRWNDSLHRYQMVTTCYNPRCLVGGNK